MGMVLKCNCKSAFQDKEYGEGRRYHNARKGGEFRCSVCNNSRDARGDDPKPIGLAVKKKKFKKGKKQR